MATRALIGYYNQDGSITTTYNHYDGYPDGLGVALDKFYGDDEKANYVANLGYVSYISTDDGSIEQTHKERAQTLKGQSAEETIALFHEDAKGGDFAYLWTGGSWVMSPTHDVTVEDFIHTFLGNTGVGPDLEGYEDSELDGELEETRDEFDLHRSIRGFRPEKSIEEEEGIIENSSQTDEMWATYVKSLVNDIRLNGLGDYAQYSESDIIEDFMNHTGL